MRLLKGDKLSTTRQTRFGEVEHEAIYIGLILGFAGYWVIENHKEKGVQYSLFEDYASGQPVRLVARSARTRAEQEAIIQRAEQMIGTPYHAVFFNCEHLANFAQTGTASSPQLQRYMAGALLGVMVFGLIWNA
jgi:hypothetical protein